MEARLRGDRDKRGAAAERLVRQVIMPSGSTACPSVITTFQVPTSTTSELGGGTQAVVEGKALLSKEVRPAGRATWARELQW